MKSSFRQSMLTSPAWPASRGGARRHPYSDIEIHGEAAERLPGCLRMLQYEVLSRERIGTRLTHTNSSPTIPGWFTNVETLMCGFSRRDSRRFCRRGQVRDQSVTNPPARVRFSADLLENLMIGAEERI